MYLLPHDLATAEACQVVVDEAVTSMQGLDLVILNHTFSKFQLIGQEEDGAETLEQVSRAFCVFVLFCFVLFLLLLFLFLSFFFSPSLLFPFVVLLVVLFLCCPVKHLPSYVAGH